MRYGLAGVVLGAIILWGVANQDGALDRPFVDYRTGTVILLRADRMRMVNWLLAKFYLQVSSVLCSLAITPSFKTPHIPSVAPGSVTAQYTGVVRSRSGLLKLEESGGATKVFS